MTNRRFGLCLAIVFVLGLALRLGFTQVLVGLDSEPNPATNYDESEYELFAAQLAAGNGFAYPDKGPTAIRPPGTSAILAPLYYVLGHSVYLAHLYFCLISALSILAVAWLARAMFGSCVALLAATWIAFYPGHFYFAHCFFSEVPFSLLVCIATGLSYVAYKRGGHLGREALAGLILGLCVLTRPQAVMAFPIAWVLILAISTLRRRDVLRPAFVTSLLAVAVVVPWAIRNDYAVGKFTISTIGGYTFWGAHNEVVSADPEWRGSWQPIDDLINEERPIEGSEVEREAATWRYGFDFLQENPGEILPLVASKFMRLAAPFTRTENELASWIFAISWIITGPLMLIGMWWLRRRKPAEFFLLMLPMAALLATVFIFYGSIRFRSSVSTLIVIPAAYAVCAIYESKRPQLASASGNEEAQ
jgi:4-amino-4-deoxy-L-arabinose transferase-like glycosyltransferase